MGRVKSFKVVCDDIITGLYDGDGHSKSSKLEYTLTFFIWVPDNLPAIREALIKAGATPVEAKNG